MHTKDILAELLELLDLHMIPESLMNLMMHIDTEYEKRALTINTEDEMIILAKCWKIFFLYSLIDRTNMKELPTITTSSIPEENQALKALCKARDHLTNPRAPVDFEAFTDVIHNQDAYNLLPEDIKSKIQSVSNQNSATDNHQTPQLSPQETPQPSPQKTAIAVLQNTNPGLPIATTQQEEMVTCEYHYTVSACAGIALAIGIAACCTGFLAPLGVAAIALAISLSVSGGTTLCSYTAWSFFKKESTHQRIVTNNTPNLLP